MNRSREYARLLLSKARGDAWVLARLAREPEAPLWSVGFHAQQAVEKAIKCVLACQGVEFPRTHDLAVLLDVLQENGLEAPPDALALPSLTLFAAVLRYDEATGDDDPGLLPDASRMSTWAAQTVSWAESIIDQALQGD